MSNAEALSPLCLLPAAILGCLPWKQWIRKRFPNSGTVTVLGFVCALLIWIVSVTLLLGESYNPFIYFRF